TRLLYGQHRLPRPGAPEDHGALDASDRLQHHHLFARQIEQCLPGVSNVVSQEASYSNGRCQMVHDPLDVTLGQGSILSPMAEYPFYRLHWPSQLDTVDDDFSGCIEPEKLSDFYVREHDGMHDRIPCQGGIDRLEKVEQCIFGVFRLVERVFDGTADSIAPSRKPSAVNGFDPAALHLQNEDAEVGSQHDEIGFAVALLAPTT